MAMEEKLSWITNLIKKKRAEGITAEESKKMEENKRAIAQNKIDRLSLEVKELEDISEKKSKKSRNKYHDMMDEISNIRRDVGLLEIRIKEKDQELKLSELKIKELRK